MPTFSLLDACEGRAVAARPAANVFMKPRRVIEFVEIIDSQCCGFLVSRQWSRTYISVFESQRPFDGRHDHLLKLRLVPVLFHMAQRRVVNTALAVHLRPG